MSWIRVGDAAQWTERRGRQVDLQGNKIAVFRDGARWIAVDDPCPHMGASLSDGRLDGDQLQCSWHEWRYDVATGQCPVRPWAKVRVYPVEIRDGGVFVETPPPSPAAGAEPEDDPEWLRWDPSRYFK